MTVTRLSSDFVLALMKALPIELKAGPTCLLCLRNTSHAG